MDANNVVAAHYRIGSALLTHVLFGAYVGAIMWAGLAPRSPGLLSAALSPAQMQFR